MRHVDGLAHTVVLVGVPSGEVVADEAVGVAAILRHAALFRGTDDSGDRAAFLQLIALKCEVEGGGGCRENHIGLVCLDDNGVVGGCILILVVLKLQGDATLLLVSHHFVHLANLGVGSKHGCHLRLGHVERHADGPPLLSLFAELPLLGVIVVDIGNGDGEFV